MTHAACTTSPQDLLAYWLDELDDAGELRFEEHLFACGACTERLRALVELGAGVRGALLGGGFAGVLPAAFVRRMSEAGLRVREYVLDPGGSVSCTIAPDDDLVVSYLRAPLRGVRRLDLVIQNPAVGTLRVSDVTFDPEAGGLTLVPSASFLRTLSHEQQHVRLLAVDGADERVIADYTFNHYPS